MTTESNPFQSSLKRNEEILWQGRPSPKAFSSASCIVQFFGWVGVFCFFFFLYFALRDLDEMEGAWVFMGGFLAVSATVAVAFLFFLPRLHKRTVAATRYAVTNRDVLIANVDRPDRATRLPIRSDQEITIHKDFRNLYSVRFLNFYIEPEQRRVTHASRHVHQLNALTSTEAEAAKQALLKAQGRDTGSAGPPPLPGE